MRRKKTGPTTWHVYARGARRLELFREPEDFQRFLELLDVFSKFTGCVLWAYALMSNHFHLVLHCSSAQLTELMKRVDHQYALYHNQKYQMSGHLLDGPYKAHPLRTPFMILRKIAYVLLNPFKAGMEASPGQYPWTCFPMYFGTEGSTLPAHLDSLWSTLGLDPARGRAQFETAWELEKRRPAGKRKDRLTALEVQEQEFEWLLEHAYERSQSLKGEDPVDVACYWGRLSGIPPRAMARHLGYSGTIAIRSILYRFRKKLRENPDLERALPLP